MTGVAIGTVLVLAALLVVVFFVAAPPAPRVALARRLPPGQQRVSALTKVTDRTVAAIESASKGRRALFDEEELRLAGVAMSPSTFLFLVFLGMVVLGIGGAALGFESLWAIPLAVVFALLAPLAAKLLLSVRTSQRRAKFADQLDDTLQLVSGNLRAGYGTVQALDAVARDADEPTKEEFARIVNQTRIGRDLGDALDDTSERMRSDDFMWTAQAIAINRETGGNLSEVLDHVGETIRERNHIRRQIKSLSAEGRLSAIVLLVLPVVVFLAVLIIQPTYISVLFTTLLGIGALVVAGVLQIVGVLWMLAVVRVRF